MSVKSRNIILCYLHLSPPISYTYTYIIYVYVFSDVLIFRILSMVEIIISLWKGYSALTRTQTHIAWEAV